MSRNTLRVDYGQSLALHKKPTDAFRKVEQLSEAAVGEGYITGGEGVQYGRCDGLICVLA